MMSNSIHAWCAAALILIGCASHEPVTAPPLVQGGAVSGLRATAGGMQMVIKPIASIADNKTYLDDDLVVYDMLPIRALIENNEYPGTLLFEPTSLHLVDPNGDLTAAMPVEDVIEKAKKSFWRTAGWGVAFGIFGLIPSAINVSNTNERLAADYRAKTLKSTTLPKNGRVEGMAFFTFAKSNRTLNGWLIRLAMTDAVSGTVVTVEQSLSGAVEERQTAGG
jgi:hypothetical protein